MPRPKGNKGNEKKPNDSKINTKAAEKLRAQGYGTRTAKPRGEGLAGSGHQQRTTAATPKHACFPEQEVTDEREFVGGASQEGQEILIVGDERGQNDKSQLRSIEKAVVILALFISHNQHLLAFLRCSTHKLPLVGDLLRGEAGMLCSGCSFLLLTRP
ncbi:hypothetical protein T439DRAFT_335486 [Meredithblackwellia eburnea MCA 4105]